MTSLTPARVVRFLYTLVFVALCLGGIYYIAVYAPRVREAGSLAPVGQNVIPQREDGETVYITARQQLLLNAYGIAFAVSLLAWLLIGIVLEMRFKVRIFRRLPRAAVPKIKHGPPSSFSPN